MAIFKRKGSSEPKAKGLLPAEDIARMEPILRTHFLNPNATRKTKSLGDATGLTGIGIHLIEIEKGKDSTEHHFHHFEDEAVYVLQGNGTALIGSNSYVIKPGDFLGYPKGGAAHSIKNTGIEILRILVIGERADHDICDYPNQKKRLWRHKGQPPSLVDLARVKTPKLSPKS